MLDQAHHQHAPPIRKGIAGPLLILCLFVLAGLIWLVIGGAVMRGAPAQGARTASSL